MRRATAGAVVHLFDRKRCIEVVSRGFAATSADQLGAGAVFEVKCLFGINSIVAVYSYCVIFPFTTRRCCRRQHGHLGSAATSLKAS